MSFIIENIGTIIVSILTIVLLVSVVLYMIKDKKKRGNSCSGGCACCPYSESCGSK